MNLTELEKLLTGVKTNRISISAAISDLKDLPFKDIGFAKIDNHRSLRQGFAEVIYCEGKTKEQILMIVENVKQKHNVILTKANKSIYDLLKNNFEKVDYDDLARIIIVNKKNQKKKGLILILTAGTSDIPVAEEAAVIAEVMGNRVEKVFDVGVAGIHRLFSNKKKIDKANVLIVVAGMEGALASVVSGITDKPIIAVPTSVGYGANFEGLSALLAMLNCCSPGVTVVNIDNGFGAGYFASLVNK